MSDLPESFPPYAERLSAWIAIYHYDHFAATARKLALRHDTLTLLRYVHENKVIGTQSTGNMPLKHIRAVTADFVHPPVLDSTIGDHVYKLRTEFEVWPLFYIHVLAEAADLLVTPEGGRWHLTNAGARFLEGDPLLQTLSLFSAWWHRVDWRVALNFEAGDLPEGFSTSTLAYLLALPIGTWITIEDFAKTLDARTGLARALDSYEGGGTWHRDGKALQWDVRHMIAEPLLAFGAVEPRFMEDPKTDPPFKLLKAFSMTWFGRALLEGLSL